MKQTFLTFFLLLVSLGAAAQTDTLETDSTLSMRKLFTLMPNRLLPMLKPSDRLDLIDYFTYNMKARVQNSLDGYSTLTALADDSLTLQVSEAHVLRLRLLTLETPLPDGSSNAILWVSRYGTSAEAQETNVQLFDVQWEPLPESVLTTPLLKLLEQEKVSTVLNWKINKVKNGKILKL